MMDGYDMSAWGWIVMLFGLVAIISLLGVTVALLARDVRWQQPRPSAREVLDGRLARGEIGPNEYERLVSALAGSGESAPPPRAGSTRTGAPTPN
jgi:uncharacterized membrane protein